MRKGFTLIELLIIIAIIGILVSIILSALSNARKEKKAEKSDCKQYLEKRVYAQTLSDDCLEWLKTQNQ